MLFSLKKLKYKNIKYVFHYLLFLILKIIKPLYWLKFGELRTNQIGHLILESDLFLTGVKPFNKNKVYLFFPKKPIANIFLYNKYKKILNLSKHYDFFYNILMTLSLKGIDVSDYIYIAHFNPITDSHYNNLNLLDLSFLNLSKKEENKESLILNTLLLNNKPYICFHIRDSFYYNNIKPNGKSTINQEYNYRDGDINKLKSSINFLINSGYKVVRVGQKYNDLLNVNNNQYIDYAGSKYQNNENDIYIIKNCNFFIGMLSGITLLPVLYKKPILWINAFWKGTNFTNNINDVIIPNKLFFKKEKRLVSFFEAKYLGAPIGNSIISYENKDIYITKNSEKEILLGVNEIINKINNKLVLSKKVQILNNKYRKILFEDYNLQKHPHILSHFLTKHKNLFCKKHLVIPFIKKYFYIPGTLMIFENRLNFSFVIKNLKYNNNDLQFIYNDKAFLRLKINYINYNSILEFRVKNKINDNNNVNFVINGILLYKTKLCNQEYFFIFLQKKFINKYEYINIIIFFDKKIDLTKFLLTSFIIKNVNNCKSINYNSNLITLNPSISNNVTLTCEHF